MRRETISLATMATFAGLMVALGYLLSSVPNVELVTATAFVAGVVLGPGRGLLTAGVGELLYAAINPYGISSLTLLAAQVLGMAIAGLSGGLVGRALVRQMPMPVQAAALAACGLVLTALFDLLTTLGFLIMSRLTLPALLGAYAYGAVFYLTHAAVNTAIFALVVPAALKVLARREVSVSQKGQEVKMKRQRVVLAILMSLGLVGGAQAQVAGLVVDSTTGRPLVGANVTVSPGNQGAATNAAGRFVLPELQPGSYQLRVSHIGYTPQVVSVRVGGTKVPELYLALVPTVVELEEVMVTGKRGKSLSWELPVSAEVVSAADIAMTNANSVADALRPVAGAFVKSYGSEASIKTVSVRGSSAEQVLVLWDGVRLNSPLAGGYDLSLIPLTAVERVEFVRSGLSSLYGADAAGGVVNIITRAPRGGSRPQARLETGIGALGGRQVQLTTSYEVGLTGVVLTANRSSSDGDFHYRTTDPVTGRTRMATRINNAVDMRELFGKATVQPSAGTRFTLSGEWSKAERGAPGSLTFPSPRARQTDESRRLHLGMETMVGGLLHLQATGFRTQLATRYVDPNPLWPSDADNTGIGSGGTVQGDLPLGRNHLLSVGASYLHEQARGTSLGTHHRDSFALFVQSDASWKRLFGRPDLQLNMLPALRVDHYDGFGTVSSPKMGLILTHLHHGHLALRANVGSSFRAPTFNDLYWPEDAFTVGNLHLRPERTNEAEVGCTFSKPLLGRLYGEANWYRRWARDLIVWGMEPSTFKWSPANVSRARITGQELKLGWEGANRRALVELTYSHLVALNTGGAPELQGRRLIYRPEHSASVRVGFNGRWWYAHTVALYVGSRYVDEANTKSLPGHTVVDANVGLRWAALGFHWTLRLSLDNLFDTHYQLADGYPMPGRLWRVGAGVEWEGPGGIARVRRRQ